MLIMCMNGSKNNQKALDNNYCDEKIGDHLPPQHGGYLLPRRSLDIVTVPCKFPITLKWEISKC